MFGNTENRKLQARLLMLSQVGAEMVAPAGVGALIDWWLGISPWGVIVGAVLGFIGGMVHLVRLSVPAKGEDSPDEGN